MGWSFDFGGCGMRPLDRNRGNGNALWPGFKQHECSGKNESDSGDLRALDHSSEHGAAAERVAPKLGDEENDTGCGQEKTGEVTVLTAIRQPEKKTNRDREEAECDIGLHRMNGNAKRGIAPTRGKRVSVGDGPWNVRARAVARTGKQCADLLECETESQGCCEYIGGNTKRQTVNTDIDSGNGQRDDGTN